MTGLAIEVLERRLDHPDAVALVARIQAYYSRIYGGHDSDPTDPATFAPPVGRFVVAYDHGVPVACGGWRRRGDAAEIKRMFVLDTCRGTGVGRLVLGELERLVVADGIRRIVLNTGSRQPDAIRFYEAAGYRPTDERFGPYADRDAAKFYEKSVASG